MARRLAAEAQRAAPGDTGESRLALLKALGDNTRYAIYLELARSPRPRSTGEISEALGGSIGTGKSRSHRAHGRLAAVLRSRGSVRAEVA